MGPLDASATVGLLPRASEGFTCVVLKLLEQ
jgi:hypothetical protein